MKFSEMGLNSRIMRGLDEMKFINPTPIQEQTIPLLLQGEDIFGQAKTGTGKTGAFGIFILEKLLADKERSFGSARVPKALILAPTRELALQVATEIGKMGKYTDIHSLAVYGGQEIEKQLRQLDKGVDIVVGTPGRVLDHIERGSLDLSKVEIAVLDEADRMLDMGFIEDVENILKHTNKKRQTLLFSATMPEQIKALSHKYMVHPQVIKVSADELTAEGIRQYYVEVSRFDRLNALIALLRLKKPKLALIFTRTKAGADKLATILKDRRIRALCLHGDMSQNKRDKTMDIFRKGHIEVLVATDVAARGIDVAGITHVINYDMPEEPETYIHRIGRTSRMGRGGEAISLVFMDQTPLLYSVESLANTKVEKMELDYPRREPPSTGHPLDLAMAQRRRHEQHAPYPQHRAAHPAHGAGYSHAQHGAGHGTSHSHAQSHAAAGAHHGHAAHGAPPRAPSYGYAHHAYQHEAHAQRKRGSRTEFVTRTRDEE
jgi:ATP-dependent RNA helicase DeaD